MDDDEDLIRTDRAATEAEFGYCAWDGHGAAFWASVWAPTEPTGPPGGPARMAAAIATQGAPWWPGANNTIQRASVDGGSIVDGYQPKGLWHTTETSIWPSYSTNFHPHITVALAGGRFAARGHIRHDRGARALRNISGGVQTNRARVWQVEIVTFADRVDTDGLPAAMEDGLGRYAQWLAAEWGVPMVSTVRFKTYPSSYGEANGVRMSPAGWQRYTGWCGHMHAPENEHGDPGLIDAARILKGDGMAEADIIAAIERVRGQLGRDLRSVVRVLTTGEVDATLINPDGDPKQVWIADAVTLDEVSGSIAAVLGRLDETAAPVVVQLSDGQLDQLAVKVAERLAAGLFRTSFELPGGGT